MEWTVVVGRYSPPGEPQPKGEPGQPFRPPYQNAVPKVYQTFKVDLPEHAMVLDALIAIREYQDESLGVRCACRSAICGSCAMWVNGHARLVCTSKLRDFTPDGKVTVEAPPSMPIVRDLVCDMTPFWKKNFSVKPWLENKQPVPQGEEYCVPNAAMEELLQEVSCISCGACLMDCESFAVNSDFTGPAALAKAYRYTADPRDAETTQRLGQYSEPNGVWDCTHCYECVQQCPKGVAPLDQILKLRKMAVDAGFTHNTGTRHADAFAESVRDSGRLNELTLMPKSLGLFNIPAQLQSLPAAFNLLRAGKFPPLIHHAVPHVERIKNLFKKIGGRFK
ncbi:MAG TPA: succinate dehydrogenase/fumarate reductase iron-sulfur subunit [Candidatus Eremiobacteraceae bacterium]|nr:succinate dehydrogenase/fumarate reductase iron-sulfur subunit [Candidatus Eremiobacteraceae bacterium]